MSASKFLEIFRHSSVGGDTDKHNAFGAWKAKNKTWLNYNRKELEEAGLSKRVGFALTAETAAKLNKTAEFDKLVSGIRHGKPNRGPFLDEENGAPIVIFPGVPFEKGIERVLDKFLGIGTAETAKGLGLVKGHVLGINTGALLGVKESILGSKSLGKVVSKEELDSATKFLDVLVDHLTKLDIESGSIKNFSSKILSKYYKNSTRFLVELQSNDDNAESAKLVQKLAGRTLAASTGIRGLLTPGGHQKALVGKLTEILKAQGLTDPEQLIKFESSPPLIKMIEDEIVSVLSGKAKKFKDEYSGTIPVGNLVKLYVNDAAQAEYNKKLKTVKAEAIKYKAKLANIKTTTLAPEDSTARLEALLKERLRAQIEKNMGDGNATNILNYRSGRFADSAKIERLTTSRQGLITAFYSYLKNPYATFSEGGAQQSPKTRDPKTLISKSIREIAATLVGNRLKAVLA